MNPVEYLIALDYIEKKVRSEKADARKEVEAHYRDRMTHERDRYGNPRRSFGYYLGDEKLAAFYFSQAKPKPERRDVVATCYDWDAAMEDDNPDFAEWLAKRIKSHIGELAEEYVRETGDLVDGVAVEERVTPAEPAGPEKFNFRPNMERIERHMQPRLPEVVAGLLEGGGQ